MQKKTPLAAALLVLASPMWAMATPRFSRARAPRNHLEKQLPQTTRLRPPIRGQRRQAELAAPIERYLGKLKIDNVISLGALIEPVGHPSDARVTVPTREERFLVESKNQRGEPIVSLLRVRERYDAQGKRGYRVIQDRAAGVVGLRDARTIAARALRLDAQVNPMGLTKDNRHYLFFGAGTNVPVTVDFWTGEPKVYPALHPSAWVIAEGANEGYAKKLGLR